MKMNRKLRQAGDRDRQKQRKGGQETERALKPDMLSSSWAHPPDGDLILGRPRADVEVSSHRTRALSSGGTGTQTPQLRASEGTAPTRAAQPNDKTVAKSVFYCVSPTASHVHCHGCKGTVLHRTLKTLHRTLQTPPFDTRVCKVSFSTPVNHRLTLPG